jgi:hypothetical protein
VKLSKTESVQFLLLAMKVKPANGNAGPPGGVSTNMTNTSTSVSGNNGLSAGARHVTMICVSVASCFTVLSGPFELFILLVVALYFNVPEDLNGKLITLRSLNACVDPLIYGIMWGPIRKSAHQVRLVLYFVMYIERYTSSLRVNVKGYPTLEVF